MKAALYVLICIQFAFAAYAADPNVSKSASPDAAIIDQYVKAQSEISRSIFSKKIDSAAIMVQFEKTLPLVKNIDAKYKTQYSQELSDAIKECASGVDYGVNTQIIGKGFQHVTVLAIRQELDLMAGAGPEEMKAGADKIAAYFEVIRPTMARRDKGFFEGKQTLEAAAEDAIAKLKKADRGELLSASRELEDVIARTYALSLVYEIIEVEKKRDSDPNFCEIKRTESKMFYRIIQPRIERHSPKSNQIILNILNGSFGAMNSADIERYLSEGLGIKLR